jgi:hypothetical protein
MAFSDQVKKRSAAALVAAASFLPGCGRPDPVYITNGNGQQVLIDRATKDEAMAHIKESFKKILDAAHALDKEDGVNFPTKHMVRYSGDENFFSGMNIALSNALSGKFELAEGDIRNLAFDLLPDIDAGKNSKLLKAIVTNKITRPLGVLTDTISYLDLKRRADTLFVPETSRSR